MLLYSAREIVNGDKVRQIECTSKKEKLSSVARLGWNFCELSFWIIRNLVWKNHWPEIRRHWLFLNRLNSRKRISFFLTSRQNLPLPKSLKWLRKRVWTSELWPTFCLCFCFSVSEPVSSWLHLRATTFRILSFAYNGLTVSPKLALVVPFIRSFRRCVFPAIAAERAS